MMADDARIRSGAPRALLLPQLSATALWPGSDGERNGDYSFRCAATDCLVPERVSWGDPTGTQPGDRVYALERPIAFTELSPDELAAHARMFGPSALDFDISDLRGLGALPVIYLPDSNASDLPLAQIGASLLARLADASQVVAALARTQQLTAPTIELDLTLRDGQRYSRSFNEHETRAVREYSN